MTFDNPTIFDYAMTCDIPISFDKPMTLDNLLSDGAEHNLLSDGAEHKRSRGSRAFDYRHAVLSLQVRFQCHDHGTAWGEYLVEERLLFVLCLIRSFLEHLLIFIRLLFKEDTVAQLKWTAMGANLYDRNERAWLDRFGLIIMPTDVMISIDIPRYDVMVS